MPDKTTINADRIRHAVNLLWKASEPLQVKHNNQMTEAEWVLAFHSLLIAIKTGEPPEKQQIGI